MNQKVLVTYASWCGSTAEIAREMARVLAEKGETVDLLPVKDVKTLDGYKSVVLGSALRAGKWHPEALDFVKRRRAALAGIPVSVFTVCLTLKDDTPENRQVVSACLAPLRALVKPAGEGFFAGKVDYKKMDFVMRLLMRNLIKAPEGDYRNWESVRAWAGEVEA